MRRVLLLLLCLAFEPAAAQEKGRLPDLIQYPPEALMQSRELIRADAPALREALAVLITEADQALSAGPFSVTVNPTLAASGDPHDYHSQAPYWWPDPDASDGLPYIRRDGEVNPEAAGSSSDAPALRAMADAVFTLALAYYLTDRIVYAEHAASLLRAWFIDGDTAMNPHLRYAQAIPGRAEGRNYGIIETRRLLDVVDAVALLEGAPGWSTADREKLRVWFSRYLDWLLESPFGLEEAARPNNHGTWYDVQVVGFARFVGREDLARRVLDEALVRRLERHIAADGRQPEELARTNSLTYSVFNLLALTRLADSGTALGMDLWHNRPGRRASLRRALDFLVPYLSQTRLWPYRQISEPAWWPAAEVLRRAARAYGDEHYVQCLHRLPLESGGPDDRLRLLLPVAEPGH